MKSFFASMNLARAILPLSVIGSIALAAFGWSRSRRLTELREHRDVNMPRLAEQVVALGHRHTQLTQARTGENLQGETNLQSYIYKIAGMDRVEVGNLDMTPSRAQPSKGVEDEKYRIKPAERERSFKRSTIANFLFSLEQQSRRVKVTDIKIEVAQKRLKPHEIPDDSWTFEAEVTSRQRVE